MRTVIIPLTVIGLLLAGPSAFAQPAEAASTAGACAQITAACKQAGFVPQGATTGLGLVVDCIRPIIAGAPQRKKAAKPLPEVDPQVVASCKEQNPNFGKGGGAKSKPGAQPMTNPPGKEQ
jgi:hypothetical protein